MKVNGPTDGERLKRARLRAGLTQVQLAERLGTLQCLISQWESRKKFTYVTRQRFEGHLDIDWGETVAGAGSASK